VQLLCLLLFLYVHRQHLTLAAAAAAAAAAAVPVPVAYRRYIYEADSGRYRLIKGKQFKLSLADDAASLPDEFKVSS
jgi:hypothetical protein